MRQGVIEIQPFERLERAEAPGARVGDGGAVEAEILQAIEPAEVFESGVADIGVIEIERGEARHLRDCRQPVIAGSSPGEIELAASGRTVYSSGLPAMRRVVGDDRASDRRLQPSLPENAAMPAVP